MTKPEIMYVCDTCHGHWLYKTIRCSSVFFDEIEQPKDCEGVIDDYISLSSLRTFLENKAFDTDQDGMTETYKIIVLDDILQWLQQEVK